jgi:hypothetical protein
VDALVEALVEGFGEMIWWIDLNGGGKWWRCWWRYWWRDLVEGFGGGIWWSDLVEALVEVLVEGFGGGIWWRDFVEGNGGGKWWRCWWRDLVEAVGGGGVGGGIGRELECAPPDSAYTARRHS